MLLKIACPCGHIGVAAAETLPRDLTCWRCGTSRHVEPELGACVIQSTERRPERVNAILAAR
jgi:hypothetical protein